MSKEKNLEAIGAFFLAKEGKRKSNLTYTKDGQIVIDNESVTVQIEGIGLNVGYTFDDNDMEELVGLEGPCYGKFSPNFQEFTYDTDADTLIVEGTGTGKKKGKYKAVFDFK